MKSLILRYFKLFFGTFSMGIVIITYIIMSESVQILEKTYSKPFLLSYIGHCFFVSSLLVWLIYSVILKCLLYYEKIEPPAYSKPPISYKRYMWLAPCLAIFHGITGFAYYISMYGTRVSENAAISESIPAFVFVLSIPLLRESVTLVKLLSLVISLSGVLFITILSGSYEAKRHVMNQTSYNASVNSKGADSVFHSPYFGYSMVIIASFSMAIYLVIYKKFSAFHEISSIWHFRRAILIFGLLGFSYAIIFSPTIFITHFSNFEPLKKPTWYEVRMLAQIILSDFLMNFFIALSLVMVSPLFYTMFTLLIIPGTIFSDYIIYNVWINFWGVGGIIFIIIGFCGFCLAKWLENKLANRNHNIIKFSALRSRCRIFKLIFGWYPESEMFSTNGDTSRLLTSS